MKEDFLHYVWRTKQISNYNLQTSNNKTIEILNFGFYTQLQGPDFFNALIKIDNQLWAGNVEMHVKSSDWYVHHHETDSNYNNVILHVVWDYDVDIFNASNQTIPTLIIKNYIDKNLLRKYKKLIKSPDLINCSSQIHLTPQHIISQWKERIFMERLEYKIKPIEDFKNLTQSNWILITYMALAKAFGLNTNGEIFKQMIFSIPENVISKVRHNLEDLEALFLGMLNLLPSEAVTNYEENITQKFKYITHKYNLKVQNFKPDFFKHRPDNFPTIRSMQLAKLIYENENLFDKIMSANNLDDLKNIFKVTASEFWNSHYTFNTESPFKLKKTSNEFINLILINAVIPLMYVYNKSINKEIIDQLIGFLEFLPVENNNATKIFNKLQFPINSAFDSQVVLHLKLNYCDLNRCLECAIGNSILKS